MKEGGGGEAAAATSSLRLVGKGQGTPSLVMVFMKGPYTNHSEARRLDGEWSPSYVPPATVSSAWGWGFPFLTEVGKSIKVEVKREGCPTSLLGRVGWAEEGNG